MPHADAPLGSPLHLFSAPTNYTYEMRGNSVLFRAIRIRIPPGPLTAQERLPMGMGRPGPEYAFFSLSSGQERAFRQNPQN
jgi:hypothetical protein